MPHPDFAAVFQGFASDTEAAAEQPLPADISSDIFKWEPQLQSSSCHSSWGWGGGNTAEARNPRANLQKM